MTTNIYCWRCKKLATKVDPTACDITNEKWPKHGGIIMGKVTVELDQQTHLKLKLICTTKDVKIREYVEELLAKHIAEDYRHLDIPK